MGYYGNMPDFSPEMEDPERNYEIKIEFVGLPTEKVAIYSSPFHVRKDFSKLCKDLRDIGFTKTTNPKIIGGSYNNYLYIPPDKIKRVTLTTKK